MRPQGTFKGVLHGANAVNFDNRKVITTSERGASISAGETLPARGKSVPRLRLRILFRLKNTTMKLYPVLTL